MGLKGWGRKLQFSDRRLQKSDRGDVGFPNFNFVSEFPQNGGWLPASNFEFLDIFWQAKMYGKSCYLSLYHDGSRSL